MGLPFLCIVDGRKRNVSRLLRQLVLYRRPCLSYYQSLLSSRLKTLYHLMKVLVPDGFVYEDKARSF